MRQRLAYVQMASMILVLSYLFVSVPAISEGDVGASSSVEEISRSFFLEETPGSSTGFLRMPLERLNDSSSDWESIPLDVPPAPKLLSPANGSALNTLIPVLEIDTGIPETPSSPKIELSLDAQFTTSRMVSMGCGQRWGHYDWFDVPGSRSGSGNLLPSTRYYWRARTAYGNACGVPSPEWGPWSEVYSFVTGSGGVILPGSQLLSPPNGGIVFELRPTLSWQPVSGALGMMIWVLGTTPEARVGALLAIGRALIISHSGI